MTKKTIICPTCGTENTLPCEKCSCCGTYLEDADQKKPETSQGNTSAVKESIQGFLQKIKTPKIMLPALLLICAIIFLMGRISAAPYGEKTAVDPNLRILSKSVTLVIPDEKSKSIELTAEGDLPEAFLYKILKVTGEGFSGELVEEEGKTDCELIISADSEGEGSLQLGLVDSKTEECVATDTVDVKIIDAGKEDEPVAGNAFLSVYSDSITIALPEEKQKTIHLDAGGSLPEKIDFQVLETTGSGFVGDWTEKSEENSREFIVYGVSEGEGTVKIGLVNTETSVCIASKTIVIKVIDTDTAVSGEEADPACLNVFSDSVTLRLPDDLQRTIKITADGALPDAFDFQVLKTTGEGFIGDWSGEADGFSREYTISAVSEGEGTIELGLIDTGTNECIATNTLAVKVISVKDTGAAEGKVNIISSAEEISIGVAEESVVSISMEGEIPENTRFVSYYLGDEQIIDSNWGETIDNSADLTITGTGKGKGAVLVCLEDSSTNYVYVSTVINITVN